MDEDRIAGAAQETAGNARQAAGAALGDAKLQAEGKADQAAVAVANAVGGAKDAVRDWGDDVQGELAHLRGEVARLMRERVAPALAGAAETAEGYARQAGDVVARRSERASAAIEERPLLAAGLVAAVGYLLGRLASGTPRVRRRP